MSYIPSELKNINAKFKILKMRTTKVLGADKITETEIGEFFCNFKGRGTQSVVDGKVVIDETADITTFWRPDIQSDCKIVRVDNGAKYEIIGEVEDIEAMHIALKFKVRRLKGKFNG